MRLIDADALTGPLELQRASYARIGGTERAIAYADCLWEIAQAPTIGGWIGADKRPPKQGRYLVWGLTRVIPDHNDEPNGYWQTKIAQWFKGIGWDCKVKFWQMLPEPPKEGEKSSKDENALARLLTLDELRALPVGAVVWYEQRALTQTYIMPMVVTADGHIGCWALGVCMDEIGQDDRCWSARPADEQREATPWRA